VKILLTDHCSVRLSPAHCSGGPRSSGKHSDGYDWRGISPPVWPHHFSIGGAFGVETGEGVRARLDEGRV
jgi:hypothetical protein